MILGVATSPAGWVAIPLYCAFIGFSVLALGIAWQFERKTCSTKSMISEYTADASITSQEESSKEFTISLSSLKNFSGFFALVIVLLLFSFDLFITYYTEGKIMKRRRKNWDYARTICMRIAVATIFTSSFAQIIYDKLTSETEKSEEKLAKPNLLAITFPILSLSKLSVVITRGMTCFLILLLVIFLLN